MSFARSFALAAAIVLGVAGAASAATKTHKNVARQSVQHAPAASGYINSESPELTGGGSLGHNEMKGW